MQRSHQSCPIYPLSPPQKTPTHHCNDSERHTVTPHLPLIYNLSLTHHLQLAFVPLVRLSQPRSRLLQRLLHLINTHKTGTFAPRTSCPEPTSNASVHCSDGVRARSQRGRISLRTVAGDGGRSYVCGGSRCSSPYLLLFPPIVRYSIAYNVECSVESPARGSTGQHRGTDRLAIT